MPVHPACDPLCSRPLLRAQPVERIDLAPRQIHHRQARQGEHETHHVVDIPAAVAGWIADHGGWYVYYVMSFVLALPGLAMVYLTRRKIDAPDRLRLEGGSGAQ